MRKPPASRCNGGARNVTRLSAMLLSLAISAAFIGSFDSNLGAAFSDAYGDAAPML